MKPDQKIKTNTITQELLDYIVLKIVWEIDPEKIILFGSYARGDYNQNSDLDLFIIKNSEESGRFIRRKVDKLFRGRCFALDLYVRNSDEVNWNLEAENPFYIHHVFKEGKILYEKK